MNYAHTPDNSPGFLVALLSLADASASNNQQNKTKRWIENSTRYPGRLYQQVSFADSSQSIGERQPGSYNTPQPLLLFTPAAVLEQQEARVRHIYLKPTPSSPPALITTSQRAPQKLHNQKLEAQPQFHSYSTFILPPQLQATPGPVAFPIRHPQTAYYGYSNVPTSTLTPLQQQKSHVKHVYLDQKHPILHYHYQTYPNSKPLVIHNTIPDQAPKVPANDQHVKEVTESQEEAERDSKEDAERLPRVREESEEEDEEREQVRREDDDDEEEEEGTKENLEEADDDEEEEEEKENLQEEEDEDNRRSHGPQVFYKHQNYNQAEDDEDDEEEPEQKKRYKNEESEEDEDEEENKRHDVTVRPSSGFDYKRLAEEYKNIQYPKPYRIPISPFTGKPEVRTQVPLNGEKPYPNSLKNAPKTTKPNVQSKKPTGANINIRLQFPSASPYPQSVKNIKPKPAIPNPQQDQPPQVPVFYQRLRNYFTPSTR